MDEFSYLIVLVSIVLGLGITRLLTGLGALIEGRDRVRPYGPALAWAGILLVVHVQTWWTMFGYRDRDGWTFAAFLAVLLQPALLYLLAALVLPTTVPEEGVDLRARYHEQTRWFFGLLSALLVGSLARDLALDGALPGALNVGFHAVLLALAGAGALTRREGFHRVNAAVTAGLVGGYIALLFSRLG